LFATYLQKVHISGRARKPDESKTHSMLSHTVARIVATPLRKSHFLMQLYHRCQSVAIKKTPLCGSFTLIKKQADKKDRAGKALGGLAPGLFSSHCER
jgi:hypothetical protein